MEARSSLIRDEGMLHITLKVKILNTSNRMRWVQSLHTTYVIASTVKWSQYIHEVLRHRDSGRTARSGAPQVKVKVGNMTGLDLVIDKVKALAILLLTVTTAGVVNRRSGIPGMADQDH